MLPQILSRGLSILQLSESLTNEVLRTSSRHVVPSAPTDCSVQTFVSLAELDLAKGIALCVVHPLDLAYFVLADGEASGVALHTSSLVWRMQILNRIVARQLCQGIGSERMDCPGW